MKLILENWKSFLKEGIHSSIQKQIDFLMSHPDLKIEIHGTNPGVEIISVEYSGAIDVEGHVVMRLSMMSLTLTESVQYNWI